MNITEATVKDTCTFGCTNCGAELKYQPGTTKLKCAYCSTENEIPVLQTVSEELDYYSYLDSASRKEDSITIHAVKCEGCGATSSVDPKIESTLCPYCGSPLIEKNAKDDQIIRPRSLLPFKLDRDSAKKAFGQWIKKLWFAPSALTKAVLNFDHFKGIYLPYWTYDSRTHSAYIGQRGDHYYVTESYTATENGKHVTRTRQVRRTRWTNTSGRVNHAFDDVLVCASNSVPVKYIDKLEPWDLPNLVPFDEKFLSGFTTEKYQTQLQQGFEIAKVKMDNTIYQLVAQDIGGDEQRIISVSTEYNNITFKHILLPAYVSAYRFKGKLFQFLVNARTGEVQGERPWSAWKITFAVLGGLLVLALLYVIVTALSNQ